MKPIEIAGHEVSPLVVYGAAGALGLVLYLHLRRPSAPAPYAISAAGVGVPGPGDQITTPEPTGGGNPNPTPTPTPVEPAGAPPLPAWAAGIPGAHWVAEFIGAVRPGQPQALGYRLVDARGRGLVEPGTDTGYQSFAVGPGHSLPGGGLSYYPGIPRVGV